MLDLYNYSMDFSRGPGSQQSRPGLRRIFIATSKMNGKQCVRSGAAGFTASPLGGGWHPPRVLLPRSIRCHSVLRTVFVPFADFGSYTSQTLRELLLPAGWDREKAAEPVFLLVRQDDAENRAGHKCLRPERMQVQYLEASTSNESCAVGGGLLEQTMNPESHQTPWLPVLRANLLDVLACTQHVPRAVHASFCM